MMNSFVFFFVLAVTITMVMPRPSSSVNNRRFARNHVGSPPISIAESAAAGGARVQSIPPDEIIAEAPQLAKGQQYPHAVGKGQQYQVEGQQYSGKGQQYHDPIEKTIRPPW